MSEMLEGITYYNNEATPIVTVTCKLCGHDRIEPVSDEPSTYRCCLCGFVFTSELPN
jgi:transposase-like protein